MELFPDKHNDWPYIKDFTSPNNELRYMPVKKMTLSQFIWFHPFGYIAFGFGTYFFLSLFNAIFLLYLAFTGKFTQSIFYPFLGLFSILIINFSINKIKAMSKGYKKGMNMYDIFLREYPEVNIKK